MSDQSWTPLAIATLALAIATLLLAIASGLSPALRLIKSQKGTPKKTPTKRRRIPFTIILLIVGLIVNLWILITNLRSPQPLSKGMVLMIAVSVSAINASLVYTLFAFVIDRVLRIIRDVINDQRDFRSAFLKVLDKLLDDQNA